MIRFGPAGIPLSCKGRTLRDGIEDVHGLGLNAMEVQMVRVNAVERYPDEEEVGMTPLEVESDLIMDIVRAKGKKETRITKPTEKIKEEDLLVTLASGLVQNFSELKELGQMGKELDVQLSMHTPYYIDLSSNNDLTARSMDSIRWAGVMTHQMEGIIVATHMGLYGRGNKKKATETITQNIAEIVDWWKKNELKPMLGLETSGRQEVFGSLEEVLRLCDQMKGTVVPVINFAHFHARNNGILRESQDFEDLLDQAKAYVGEQFYTHFSGVEHESGNEKRITPIKKGDLKFEPLADYLVEADPNITVISSSPLLEHDAMYMKVIFERVLTKKVAKEAKTKKDKREEKEEKEERPEKKKEEKKEIKKPKDKERSTIPH